VRATTFHGSLSPAERRAAEAWALGIPTPPRPASAGVGKRLTRWFLIGLGIPIVLFTLAVNVATDRIERRSRRA
jgi:hypothetical protein